MTEIVVLMSASLYLSAKVNEHEQAKIRDIINVVQFTLNSQSDPDEDDDLFVQFRAQPRITLPEYAKVRQRILEQEQTLIRLLNFDFSPRKGEFILDHLLNGAERMNMKPYETQVALAMLNDM